MSSFFGDEMPSHSECVASTISSHSDLAGAYPFGRRWLKKVLMALVSSSVSGIRRTKRERTSPMPVNRCQIWQVAVDLVPQCTHTWSSKDAYHLAGGASIVGDWDDIAEGSVVRFSDLIENIHETIRCTAAREDDNTAALC